MISLIELSNKLNTSKMNILNHYKRLINKDKNLTKHTKLRSNRRFFDNKLATKIMRSFDYSKSKPKENNDQLVHQLELENKRLTVALNHEQELHLRDSKALQSSNKELLTYRERSKHGFIWKLFH